MNLTLPLTDVYMPGNERKVVRSGSWKDVTLLVGSRDYEYADVQSYIGLRLVRDYLGSNSR